MKLSFNINKPFSIVFDHLTDMQKFVLVHPVITKMDKLPAGGYFVYETLKFGFLPVSFTYTATIESNMLEGTVVMYATVMKFTKIKMDFTLKDNGASTTVCENIHFKSFLPIKFILQRIFKKQHEQLFKNISLV